MKRLFIGIVFFLTVAGSVFAQSKNSSKNKSSSQSGTSMGTVLAVIKHNKTEQVTSNHLRSRIEFLKKETGVESFTIEQKKQILDSLISEKLVAQAAAKEGITISDSQVNAAFLNTFSQQLGQQVTESQLSDFIERQTGKTLGVYMKDQTGMSLDEYKEYLKNQLVAQQYVYSKKQEELKKVVATDEEIRSAYEMNKSAFVWNDMAKLFLVMVPKGTDAASSKSLAESLRSQYQKSKSAEEKIKLSEDNGKKYQAGYLVVAKTSSQAQQLGWSYDKLMELFGRNKGYVSELSATENDYQFYSVVDKYNAKMLELSDVVEPDSTITVYDYIKQRLSAQKQSQFLTTAAQEIAKSLETKTSVERKKTGTALDKVLESL